MISLLRENPSLGRVLRPLCHMLLIAPPDYLKLPQKPRNPRPPHQGPLRPRRPKPAEKPPLTLLEHLLQKYPPPQRPMLPGHRYTPAPPFKNSA